MDAQRAKASGLRSVHWTLVSAHPSSTRIEIQYVVGGCSPAPRGVVIREARRRVTISVEAPRPTEPCTNELGVRRGAVTLSHALGSRSVQHGGETQ
jgi:hypothetical protein